VIIWVIGDDATIVYIEISNLTKMHFNFLIRDGVNCSAALQSSNWPHDPVSLLLPGENKAYRNSTILGCLLVGVSTERGALSLAIHPILDSVRSKQGTRNRNRRSSLSASCGNTQY
jgi:hypothetical protein